MGNLKCKSKGAAMSILDTLAAAEQKGTRREALLAVREWIAGTVTDCVIKPETTAMLEAVFGCADDEAERAGEAWDKSGRSGEPAHGARWECLWNGETKAWEPETKKCG
jgi:hypothetical protein